ncbi:MAG: Nif3-like dinuclear metal center hexameric protein [Vibrionaceae bacterium]
MNNLQLEATLNAFLMAQSIKDHCPNGLQVQGRPQVQKVVTGVTACQALLDAACDLQADAILVHHGYFWNGESPVLRGMKYKRIKTLLDNEINLYAYHLPLDMHATVGNNVQLANLLDIKLQGGMQGEVGASLALWGELATPCSASDFAEKVERALGRKPQLIEAGTHLIKKIGWCSGAAQDQIALAAAQQLDAFLSGEISERTTFLAQEQNVHYFAAGHHATERAGVKALGEWLQAEHGLAVTFIDIDNPV